MLVCVIVKDSVGVSSERWSLTSVWRWRQKHGCNGKVKAGNRFPASCSKVCNPNPVVSSGCLSQFLCECLDPLLRVALVSSSLNAWVCAASGSLEWSRIVFTDRIPGKCAVLAFVVCFGFFFFFKTRLALLAWIALGLRCAATVSLHHVPNRCECFRFEMACLILHRCDCEEKGVGSGRAVLQPSTWEAWSRKIASLKWTWISKLNPLKRTIQSVCVWDAEQICIILSRGPKALFRYCVFLSGCADLHPS